MEKTPVRIRVLVTAPLYSAEFYEPSAFVAQQLSKAFGLKGIETELSPSVVYSPEKCEVTLIIHRGSDELLSRLVMEQKALGTRIFISWCKPEVTPTALARAAIFKAYAERGQPVEWLKNELGKLAHVKECEQSVSPVLMQTLKHVDGMQVWSRSAADAFDKLCSVHVLQSGCLQSEASAADLFVAEHRINQFLLNVAPLRVESGQIELLHAIEKQPIPIVFIGTPDNDPKTVALLRKFRRSAPTVILEKATPVQVESALAACRAIVIQGQSDATASIALRGAFLGRNVISLKSFATSELLQDSATYINSFAGHSIPNALAAGFYAPFEQEQRRLAATRNWTVVGNEFLDFCGIRSSQVIPLRPAPTVKAHSNTSFLNVTQLCMEGETMLARGSPAYAEEFFLYALKLDSDSHHAHAGRAKTFLARGKTEQAYECFAQASRCSVITLDTVVQLLGCAMKLHKFDDAEKALERHCTSNVANSDILYAHAICLLELNRPDEAVRKLKRIVTGNSSHPEAETLLSQLTSTHSRNSPTAQYTTVIEVPSTNEDWKKVSGTVTEQASQLRESGEVMKAISMLESVLQGNPRDAKILRELALSLAAAGNFETANKVFERAYSENPHDAQVLQGLLFSNRAAGTLSLLNEMLEKKIDTSRFDLEHRFTYAQCLVELGSVAKAKEQLRILTAMAPRDRRTKVLRSAIE